MTDEVYSYTKIFDITIGDVTNIFLDKNKDVIIIHEDKGNSRGIVSHTFGTHAQGIKELISALERYHQQKYMEKEATFQKIRKAIA
jgi:hypothetical protein